MAREFMDGFAVRNCSYICRDLLSGCDLPSDEGQRRFKEYVLTKKRLAGHSGRSKSFLSG